MSDDNSFFVGSDNVFADLGLPNPEERLLKAKLTLKIQTLLDERGMSDTQAAECFGMTVPDVGRMLDGRLSEQTVTQLFQCLNRLGRRVEVRISAEEYPPEDASLTVVAA